MKTTYLRLPVSSVGIWVDRLTATRQKPAWDFSTTSEMSCSVRMTSQQATDAERKRNGRRIAVTKHNEGVAESSQRPQETANIL